MRNLTTKQGYIVLVPALLSVLIYIGAYRQTETQEPVRVRLSVSPQQEENFNAFMSWLDTVESLKDNKSLREAYVEVFAATKQNDYASYVPRIKKLGEEVAKLSNEQKTAMVEFFTTLSPPPKLAPMQVPDNWCRVSCLFGSCEISCPAGTKPKCFCQWGSPHCGCEPYKPE